MEKEVKVGKRTKKLKCPLLLHRNKSLLIGGNVFRDAEGTVEGQTVAEDGDFTDRASASLHMPERRKS